MHFINLSGYLAASVQIKPVDQLNILPVFPSITRTPTVTEY